MIDSVSSAVQGINFDNSYAKLPERFFAKQRPKRASNPSLIKFNNVLATQLGLELDLNPNSEAINALAGNNLFHGSQPLAQAYAGHQFANFQPQLGDGRALLLGEITAKDGSRFDMQLKGSGPTPFSRNGDGLAAIGPVIREYIISEAMHKMGIPTTRALAMVTTGDEVYRETKLPGAVLTRIASSHIRVGTFQYFAARQDKEALSLLLDHVIERHYPELATSTNKAIDLLKSVMHRQAQLIAAWMGVGFIHGVMNTDNVSIAGETIDYGPCAFMNQFDPATVYSFIDKRGRYAYGNQPYIAQWNMIRFVETLLPLIDEDEEKAVKIAEEVLGEFVEFFQTAWLEVFAKKIGITNASKNDVTLIQALLELMKQSEADFTTSFRALNEQLESEKPVSLFGEKIESKSWIEEWRQRVADEPDPISVMNTVNPIYIPRNHLLDEVIKQAEQGDYQKMHKLIAVLERPFELGTHPQHYRKPPRPGEDIQNTFCGT